MTVHHIIPAKTKDGHKDNFRVEVYQFASAFYARYVDSFGFVYADNIGQSNGSYQSALQFASKYQA
jgi:hypothetical protein